MRIASALGTTVLNLDVKLDQALAPHLARVLILDQTLASARMLNELLHNIFRGQIWRAGTTATALSMAQTADPQVIFTEYAGPDLDGLIFTKALRRSNFSCRKAPVIMITGQATPAAILGARDAGVHEFLRKPYTNKDLVRRLEAAIIRPRGWIEGVRYVGPDRRRFNSAEYRGARKRRTDTEGTGQANAIQALRIVASALAAIESDPNQAFRALCAQAANLERAASDIGDHALNTAAGELRDYLIDAGTPERLTRPGLEPCARKLLSFLPTDQSERAARRPDQAA
jgi:CheY-like chemotaxis protein